MSISDYVISSQFALFVYLVIVFVNCGYAGTLSPDQNRLSRSKVPVIN